MKESKEELSEALNENGNPDTDKKDSEANNKQ